MSGSQLSLKNRTDSTNTGTCICKETSRCRFGYMVERDRPNLISDVRLEFWISNGSSVGIAVRLKRVSIAVRLKRVSIAVWLKRVSIAVRLKRVSIAVRLKRVGIAVRLKRVGIAVRLKRLSVSVSTCPFQIQHARIQQHSNR